MGCGASAGESSAASPSPSQQAGKPQAKAAAAASGPAAKKNALKAHFAKHGLEEYADKIIEASGAEGPQDLRLLGDADIDEVAKEVGLKVIQKKKLKAAIAALQNDVKVKQGSGAVDVVLMKPGTAMQASKGLVRVFLGVGWTEKGGGSVDVDLSAVSFAGGKVQDIVYWKNLRNSTKSLVHTGDVLHADKGKAKEDQERLYVWLPNLPAGTDCISFVANIFSGTGDFSQLETAWIRMVNADTNQELCRLTLSGGGLSEKALYYTKLARVGKEGPWQLMTLGKPLKVDHCTSADDMVPLLMECAGNAPLAPSGAGGVVQGVPLASPGGANKPVPSRPSSLRVCPALAVATVGGIAAATAIFMCTDFNRSMFDSSLFETGVDFSSLVPNVEMPEGLDDLLPEDALGDALDWAEGVTENIDLEAVQSAVASAADAAGEGVVMAGEFAGEGAGALMDGAGDLLGSDALADAGGALGDAGGAIADVGGDAMDGIGDVAGDAMGDAGGAVAEAAEGAGGFFGGMGEMFGGLAEGLGDALGAVGDAIGDLGDD
eukprot:TRINITY_DN101371_c0_g1_i1.p1 TRINITY_DN101371_c0_g1~~TRINITY_DN101371_c0_g1_i1.p1  ORF type:complete len:547 (-),score=128.71 TRINITY_DN101371_c0_g1_i1:142-1782(-)